MENVFLKYMRQREGKGEEGKHVNNEGPVITISREFGCSGKRIGKHLAEVLSKRLAHEGKNLQWRMLSKEILEESARELKLAPTLVKNIEDYKNRSFFENIALFFSDGYYPSDAKINNSIANFIHTAATEGNVVIVGRAAEAITKNISRSFHVRLIAPIDWRAEKISHSYGKTLSEAKHECLEMDKRRLLFRSYFEKGAPDVDFYDVTFNCKELSDDEIVEMILIIAETRGFI